MVSALSFRCTGCGNCCRRFRVAITALDLARLCRATNRPASELADWLAPDAVDMAGEPGSFVELSEGRRLLVLRQKDEACQLLGADNRCSAYAARPRDCRTFPFDFELPATPQTPGRRLSLLPLDGCDYADDANNDEAAVSLEDSQRWRELQMYQGFVANWNRQAFHRRRLRKTLGTPDDFLSAALRSAPTAG